MATYIRNELISINAQIEELQSKRAQLIELRNELGKSSREDTSIVRLLRHYDIPDARISFRRDSGKKIRRGLYDLYALAAFTETQISRGEPILVDSLPEIEDIEESLSMPKQKAKAIHKLLETGNEAMFKKSNDSEQPQKIIIKVDSKSIEQELFFFFFNIRNDSFH